MTHGSWMPSTLSRLSAVLTLRTSARCECSASSTRFQRGDRVTIHTLGYFSLDDGVGSAQSQYGEDSKEPNELHVVMSRSGGRGRRDVRRRWARYMALVSRQRDQLEGGANKG